MVGARRSVNRLGNLWKDLGPHMVGNTIAMMEYVKSRHTEGTCLFCGTPRGDGRQVGELREAGVNMIVFLGLSVSIGPTTSKGA